MYKDNGNPSTKRQLHWVGETLLPLLAEHLLSVPGVSGAAAGVASVEPDLCQEHLRPLGKTVIHLCSRRSCPGRVFETGSKEKGSQNTYCVWDLVKSAFLGTKPTCPQLFFT